jgi:hypothetical protein
MAFALDQGRALGHDGFFSPHGINALAGLGFHSDTGGGDLEYLGNPLLDGFFVRRKLRPLGKDDAVKVDDLVARLPYTGVRPPQHIGRVAPPVFFIGVREQFADIAQRCCPQQRISNRVQEHIGIAVTDRAAVMRNGKAADPQRAARFKAVGVVSDADAKIGRNSALRAVASAVTASRLSS